MGESSRLSTELFLPPPRELRLGDESVELGPASRVEAPAGLAGATLKRLEAALARLPAGSGADARIVLELQGGAESEEHELLVHSGGVKLTAGSAVGLFRAVTTLEQWLRIHAARQEAGATALSLPGIRIEDAPDFPQRGVMLDVSRNKVPTMETLKELVDLLAGWKINQLQLYTEHTFAYAEHETVWRDASPLTGEDIRELDDYCAERFMQLVPNQNSFGHFHHWLRHDAYRHLAECPEGIDHPFSREKEPFSLCATDPRSLDLLEELYAELLPHFRSELFNVGLDETLDLGLGRSREACEREGKARVYLDFLVRVHGLARAQGRRMMLWGDIVLEHPELISELPEDIIALQWGYEAGHPFAAKCATFEAAGLEHWVCPGTSSWHSFGGRTRNAIENLANAAVAGHEGGARGYLICDWGDCGHLQALPVSHAGFAAGAAFAWRADAARSPHELPLAAWLDLHAFEDPRTELGAAALGLGEAYRMVGKAPANGSALFFVVAFALLEREPRLVGNLSPELLTTELERLSGLGEALGRARPRRDGERVGSELRWTAEMLSFACRFGIARLESGDMQSFEGLSRERRASLAEELRALAETRRELWLKRNRPGGLKESMSWLSRVSDLLD